MKYEQFQGSVVENRRGSIRQQIGWLLQLAVLALLPMLIFWQLTAGFSLIWMPALTLMGIALFYVGYRLRES